ncbi:MAG: hypothetical protein ABL921_10060 [Pirellula sp.]
MTTIIFDVPTEDPELAFESIKAGADYVDYGLSGSPGQLNRILANPQAGMLEEIGISKLCNLSKQNMKFFMSMSFAPNTTTELVYRQVLKPTLKRLSMTISREDETSLAPFEIGTKTKLAIEASDVLVMDMDGLTLNTMYEVGYAEGKGIPVVLFAKDCLVRITPACNSCGRPTVSEIPALLRNVQHVRYTNRIALAMRLYFGLGGTVSALRN